MEIWQKKRAIFWMRDVGESLTSVCVGVCSENKFLHLWKFIFKHNVKFNFMLKLRTAHKTKATENFV